MSKCWNVKMLKRQTVELLKCWNVEMSKCQNVKMSNCLKVDMWICFMSLYPYVKMSKGQNTKILKMPEYHNGETSKFKMWIC